MPKKHIKILKKSRKRPNQGGGSEEGLAKKQIFSGFFFGTPKTKFVKTFTGAVAEALLAQLHQSIACGGTRGREHLECGGNLGERVLGKEQ